VVVLWVAATAATAWVRPEAVSNLVARPLARAFVALSAAGIYGVFRSLARGRELAAFLGSRAFLLGIMATALAGNYPHWLRSTLDPAYSLTASDAVSARYGMGGALAWWAVGIALVAGYFTYLFRAMRGKVDAETGEGY
jgi:cytochrome d ubiquinol oxidase subunit II